MTTKVEPHEFVQAPQGSRNALFGWCDRSDCNSVINSYEHASEEDRRRFDAKRNDVDTRRLGLNSWHGYLTAANAEAVADRIRETLKGRLYSYVNTWRYDGEPDLRVSQKMSSVKVTYNENPGAMITVSDTHGLWFIESSLADRDAANKVYAQNGELGKSAHYLVFDGKNLKMRHWNYASEKMVYTKVMPESPERLSDDYV